MLERLADMLRGQDTRGGFEATADMLSITGLTLEQFADLMGGLGYKAERGERPKVKAAPDHSRRRSPRRRTRRKPWTRPLLGDAPPTGWKGPTRPIRHRRRCQVETPGEAPDTAASGSARRHRPRRRRRRPRKCRATRRPRPRRRRSPRSRFSTRSPGRRDVVAAIAAASCRGRRRQASRREAEGRQAARQGRQERAARTVRSGPKTYPRNPPDKPAKVDPDNPFAVLAALKDKS
jgi:ATP-dependent RNA helicase SUPV3L1/SUV3